MHIAILTFDGFNELDSLIAYGMLGRLTLRDPGWRVSIASPTPRVTSMNGLTIDAHVDLAAANTADAVVIGSGMKTREVAANAGLMGQLRLDPARQWVAAQCSGTFLLAKLGLVGRLPACTDLTSKPWVQAAGVDVVNRPFVARGRVATAGGCLSAQYLSAWLIANLKDLDAAREVLHYFAPVGEKEAHVERALAHVAPQGATGHGSAPQGATGHGSAPQGATGHGFAPQGATGHGPAPQGESGHGPAAQDAPISA